MSSTPSRGPSAHSAPAPKGKPKGYLGIPRNTRLALTGGLLASGALLCGGVFADCGNPDPAPSSGYVPTERLDIVSIPGRIQANQAGLEKACEGSDRDALRVAAGLRDKMLRDPAVISALRGRADELTPPQDYNCPDLEAYAGTPEQTADAWVIKDNTVAYSRTFFDGTGKEGKCVRASTQLALEACEVLGGCALNRGYVQVGRGITLPEDIERAKELAMDACMNWSL